MFYFFLENQINLTGKITENYGNISENLLRNFSISVTTLYCVLGKANVIFGFSVIFHESSICWTSFVDGEK